MAAGKMVRAEDVVYCLEHTTIHENTLDPYGEGYQSCFTNVGKGISKEDIHRAVYWRMRKGDIE